MHYTQEQMMGFSQENEKNLQYFLQNLPTLGQQTAAVFDADGTLWSGDVGDDFFLYQIKNNLIPKAPPNPWKIYQTQVLNGDPAKAYGWLAQWNAENSQAQMQEWAERFFKETYESKVFKPMQSLVQGLQKKQVQVWIISASPRFIVQAGAKHLGINPNNVIAASVTTKGNLLTDTLEYPVPYRQQKAVLAKQKIQNPICLAAGNTWWDIEMLSLCTHLALAVHSEPSGGPNFESEQKLYQHAKNQGLQPPPGSVLWLSQRF